MQEIIIHNWDELQRVVFDDVWDDKIMHTAIIASIAAWRNRAGI